MPRVTQYQTAVTPTGYQEAGLSVNAVPDQFGAIAGGIGSLAGILEQRAEKLKTDDDKRQALDAYLGFSDQEISYLSDPNEGVYAQLGRNASGVTGKATEWYDNQYKTWTEKLSPDQQLLFDQMYGSKRNSSMTKISTHEMKQGQVYDNEQLESLATNLSLEAGNDPSTIEQSFMIVDAIGQDYVGRGHAQETVQKNIYAQKSAIVEQAIQGSLARKDAEAAAILMDQYSENLLDQRKKTSLLNQIAVTNTLTTAQSVADQVLRDNPGANQGQLRQSIKDHPDITGNAEARKQALTIIDHEYNVRKKDHDKYIVRKLSEAFIAQGSDGGISSWMDDHENRRVMSEEFTASQIALLTKESSISTDRDAYLTVTGMIYKGAGDEAITYMMGSPDKFTSGDFKILANEAITYQPESRPLNEKQSFDNTFKEVFGKPGKSKSAAREFQTRYNIFFGSYMERVREWETNNPGKKIPTTEMDLILNEMREVWVKDGFFGGSEQTLKDIPVEDLRLIRDALETQPDIPVSIENIIRMYQGKPALRSPVGAVE